MVKIAGKQIEKTLFEDFIVLPQNNEDIVIKARAVADYDEFEKLCPLPKPPGKQTRDGFIPDNNDDTHKLRVAQYGLQKIGWLAIQSLYEFEWETVEESNPKTWVRWEKELLASGFTTVEVGLVLSLILDVNHLNESKMKEARDSFLRGQEQAQSESYGQTDEPNDSQSGEPANG